MSSGKLVGAVVLGVVISTLLAGGMLAAYYFMIEPMNEDTVVTRAMEEARQITAQSAVEEETARTAMEEKYDQQLKALEERVTDLEAEIVTTEEELTSGEVTAGKGKIVGSLSYPSEQIPADLTVCAENSATNKTTCTDKHIKSDEFTYGEGYNLEVDPGEYYVYAYAVSDPNLKAYYDEYVKCGQTTECTDHTKIKVIVEEGKIYRNIDPQDWTGQ